MQDDEAIYSTSLSILMKSPLLAIVLHCVITAPYPSTRSGGVGQALYARVRNLHSKDNHF